jgi:hypothetical protein
LILREASLRKMQPSFTELMIMLKRKFRSRSNFNSESQGSVFQKNAATFFGMDPPKPGERPFKIQKVMPQ